MYYVFVVLFLDLYCVFVVGVVSVIFDAGDRKQERKKTLFYTVRSEQLLPQMGKLLFIPLANLFGVDFLLFSLILTPFCPKEEAIESALR